MPRDWSFVEKAVEKATGGGPKLAENIINGTFEITPSLLTKALQVYGTVAVREAMTKYFRKELDGIARIRKGMTSVEEAYRSLEVRGRVTGEHHERVGTSKPFAATGRLYNEKDETVGGYLEALENGREFVYKGRRNEQVVIPALSKG